MARKKSFGCLCVFVSLLVALFTTANGVNLKPTSYMTSSEDCGTTVTDADGYIYSHDGALFIEIVVVDPYDDTENCTLEIDVTSEGGRMP